ncbi:CGH_3_collapsed_G0034160.mRNA.1.CDS.1 [Saccharomyces cerevisiae]|nr:CGH_3_collapsed_G0034160.mRNA.1.CDS.1 [Saccharomyces cerevisiae]
MIKFPINILLEELSKYFLNKNEVDGLIVDFYKTIYPVYPLLEISLFEDNIRELLQLNEFNGYNIVFAGKDSRRKLETITLLTIILAFSYRRLSLSTSHSFKESFGVKSNNLTLLAHKLLALMNRAILEFGILIPEGDSDILSLEYLRSFMKTDESLPELFERNYASTNNLDLSLMATAENIYHLHLSLQVLLTSCFPINGPSYLKEVLDNIDKTKDFFKSEIPSHFKFSWRTKDEELTYQCSLFLSKSRIF